MKRVGLIVAGWASMVLGVAGLILPIIPGWFFILLGLVLLSSEYVWAHRLLQRVVVRFPRLRSLLSKVTERARGLTGVQPVIAAAFASIASSLIDVAEASTF